MTDTVTLSNGQTWRCHDKELCEGTPCVFHKPSDHPLKDAPLTARYLKAFEHPETGQWLLPLERECSHGVGHPDIDSVRWLQSVYPNSWGIHGCCSMRCCCRIEDTPPAERSQNDRV